MDNFFKNKPIFGMVHMSDGPKGRTSRAIQEIRMLEFEGVDGVIIENYHGTSGDVMEALMDLGTTKLKIGINILPNDFKRAIIMADYFGADFIQLDHVAGTYSRCEEFNVREYNDLRNRYPKIKVLGGVWPKYYYPVEGSVLEDDIKAGIERTDAVVVTGSGTGQETPLDKIKQFRELCGDHPLIIGAGLDEHNVQEQMKYADGGIVGSCFKRNKRTTDLITRELVTKFMDKKNEIS